MLKIGMVGMSEGNAHPTSWSAIINGEFDGDKINELGYPGVTDYLKANRDTLGIADARVTHILTQDTKLSKQIAATAGIEHVAENAGQLIHHVDAVILARDDAENHVEMARPFIDSGIPIFVDKPLASNYNDLRYFSNEIERGKFIMSCSSMRYAAECIEAKSKIPALGHIKLITSVGKKDWIKYGIHMLEAVFSIVDDPKPLSVINIGDKNKDIVKVEFEGGLQATLHLFADIALTFQVSVFGTENWQLIDIKNYYQMFRNNIFEFISSIRKGKPGIDFHQTEQIIKTLIAGKESAEKGHQKIYIDHAH